MFSLGGEGLFPLTTWSAFLTTLIHGQSSPSAESWAENCRFQAARLSLEFGHQACPVQKLRWRATHATFNTAHEEGFGLGLGRSAFPEAHRNLNGSCTQFSYVA